MQSRYLGVAVWMALILASPSQLNAQTPESLPGGTPQDANDAINKPYDYAWRLFLSLNRQAHPTRRGELDDTKPTIKDFDHDRPVVWETWAKASGGRAGGFIPPDELNTSEVFRPKGADPGPWEKLGPPEKVLERFRSKLLDAVLPAGSTPLSSVPLSRNGESARVALKPLIDPSLGGEAEGEEVRMNRSAYEFISQNVLYNVEGLEARLTKLRSAQTSEERTQALISFPVAAQEVKARWIRLDPDNRPEHRNLEKNRYHWRTIGNETWLLTGFHIITKDLPNWFWCDFEHVDDLVSVNGEQAAEKPSDDPITQGKAHPHTAGTKWENYRLRGIQVDFTDPTGRPTLLANTQIEKGFQQSSSCISCHSRGTAGLRSEIPAFPKERPVTLPVFESRSPVPVGSVGRPKAEWFFDENSRPRFIQTDFLWSIPFRVLSTEQ